MKNISFLLIIVSLCLFSCKNEQKSIYKENKTIEIIDSVKISFKVLENDNRGKKINAFFEKNFQEINLMEIFYLQKKWKYNYSKKLWIF